MSADGAIPIRPLPQEEVADLLEGMGARLESNPEAMVDPAFVVMLRLALAAGSADGAQADSLLAEISRLEGEVDTLKAELASAQEGNTTLRREVDRQEEEIERTAGLLRQAETRLKDTSAIHEVKANLAAARRECEVSASINNDIMALLDNPEWTPANPKHPAVIGLRKLLEASAALVQSVQEQKERTRGQVSQGKHERALAKAKATSSDKAKLHALNLAKKWEWSAQSQHRFSNGGQVPCCPCCGGLNPDSFRGAHREKGHRRSCRVPNLIRTLS